MARDVALVLSSGGARGLAHIGAIEELEARGHRITSIAGCSMGALVGGVYSAGKLKEFREWMKTVVAVLYPIIRIIQGRENEAARISACVPAL